jgi:hypothetical protein
MTPNTLMPQEANQNAALESTALENTAPSLDATAVNTQTGAKGRKSGAKGSPAPAPLSPVGTPPMQNPPTEIDSQIQAQIDAEAAARKRQEIGLSPRRNTAQSEVLRPPAQSRGGGAMQWLAMIGLSIVALVLVWMIVSRFLADQPTVASLNDQFNQMIDRSVTTAATSLATLSTDPSALLRTPGSLPIREEFTTDEGPLVRDFQPRRWSMGPVPDEGVYRIRMWPGVIAWSTLGIEPVPAYTLLTEMTVSSETPWGYGGLMTRYSDPRNFLFAQIDGNGRYRVQMQKDGAWYTLQDWTEASVLQKAGLVNTVALEDNGVFAILYANGEAIYTTPELGIPAGDAGVLAGSLDPTVAEVNFERVEMTTPEY